MNILGIYGQCSTNGKNGLLICTKKMCENTVGRAALYYSLKWKLKYHYPADVFLLHTKAIYMHPSWITNRLDQLVYLYTIHHTTLSWEKQWNSSEYLDLNWCFLIRPIQIKEYILQNLVSKTR